MQIKDKVIKLDKIDWNLLHDLQDPDFKEAKHKERVKQSIIDNGIASAVHVWLDNSDNKIYIVDGHTRKDALQELHSEGYTIDSTLPCLFLDLQDKAEAAKVLLAFNAKTAKINQDALDGFLETYEITLEEAGIEIEELHLTTYDDDLDITTLEDDTGEDDCDVEPPTIPITAKGDVYELNGHRVLCGDSTVIDDVDKLMQGERVDMVFTDPMYQDNPSEFLNNITLIADNYLIMCTLKQGFSIYNNSGWDFCFDVVLNQKIPSSMLNKAVPYYLHKNILYFKKSSDTPTLFNCDNAINIFSDSGNGYYPSVIESPKQTNNEHGLAKNPDGIMKILSGFKAHTICDLFAGSGSTLMAAQLTQRKSFNLELEEKYCDVIVRRWTKYMQDNNKEFTVKRNGETLQQYQLDKYLN